MSKQFKHSIISHIIDQEYEVRHNKPTLSVGDVFKSRKLVDCHNMVEKRDGIHYVEKNTIYFGRGTDQEYYNHETKEGGWERNVKVVINNDARDEFRADAEFVVFKINETEEEDIFGDEDTIYVYAKRLDKNGQYDMNGEEIGFYFNGALLNSIADNEMKLTKKMYQNFIDIDKKSSRSSSSKEKKQPTSKYFN